VCTITTAGRKPLQRFNIRRISGCNGRTTSKNPKLEIYILSVILNNEKDSSFYFRVRKGMNSILYGNG
jgi:hypothetical protein